MGISLGGVGLGERGENVGSNILEGKVELATQRAGQSLLIGGAPGLVILGASIVYNTLFL